MNKMEGEIGGGVMEESKALFWMLHLKYQWDNLVEMSSITTTWKKCLGVISTSGCLSHGQLDVCEHKIEKGLRLFEAYYMI